MTLFEYRQQQLMEAYKKAFDRIRMDTTTDEEAARLSVQIVTSLSWLPADNDERIRASGAKAG